MSEVPVAVIGDQSPRSDGAKAGKWSVIREISRIRTLASSIRQEILDNVQAMGPCAIGDIARELHRTPENLYYHVARLTELGLLREFGKRATQGRPEVLYDLPAGPLRVLYDPEDPANVEAVTDVARSMLRVAEKDFRAGFLPGLAVASGPDRNLWAARTKGWVRTEDLAEVNRLLNRLADLLVDGNSSEGGSLIALTWILAPVTRRNAVQSNRDASGKLPR